MDALVCARGPVQDPSIILLNTFLHMSNTCELYTRTDSLRSGIPCLQTLISLLDMYDDAVREGRPRAAAIEAEFRAYHLLLLMGSHGRFKGSTSQFVTSMQVWDGGKGAKL